jgi:hypothetical protein
VAAHAAHAEQVAGVEHRREHAQQVAEHGLRADGEAVRHQQGAAGQRERQPAHEARVDALAEQRDRGGGHEHGRKVGHERGVGHRGVRDGLVPHREVRGEEHAAQQHPVPARERSPDSIIRVSTCICTMPTT